MTHRDPALEVVVERGRTAESVHRVHAAVADGSGALVRCWGEPGRPVLLRSAAKPFQALPLVEDGAADRFGLEEKEIALCCGSHNSEARHLETARSILAKAGVAESRLVCGPHRPLLSERARELAEAGVRPSSVMSNCSGKHAGMLALAAHHGWPLEGYERPDHPVQRRIAREVARWMRAPLEEFARSEELATAEELAPSDELDWEVDGCGVPSFVVSTCAAAAAAARLAVASRSSGSSRRVVAAMTRHPFMVAGTKRLCTRLMEEEAGRVFAKVGAEGVYLAGDLERGLGIALKVEDGARRAAPPALLAVLERAGVLSPGATAALAGFASPPVTNTLGAVVGRISVRQ